MSREQMREMLQKRINHNNRCFEKATSTQSMDTFLAHLFESINIAKELGFTVTELEDGYAVI